MLAGVCLAEKGTSGLVFHTVLRVCMFIYVHGIEVNSIVNRLVSSSPPHGKTTHDFNTQALKTCSCVRQSFPPPPPSSQPLPSSSSSSSSLGNAAAAPAAATSATVGQEGVGVVDAAGVPALLLSSLSEDGRAAAAFVDETMLMGTFC